MIIRNSKLFFFFIMLCACASFYQGWYLDVSKPISGIGWADQTMYHNVAYKIYTGNELVPNDFHYQIGYSLLGASFYFLGFKDPFAVVSFISFILSITFLYLGMKNNYSKIYIFIFISMVFFRIGDVRKFSYAQELFLIPWNNQILFLALSFYFYLYSFIDHKSKDSFIKLIIIGLLSGFVVGTREESILFILPLLVYYLYKKKIEFNGLILVLLFMLVGYSPNIYYKYSTFNIFFGNVRPNDHGISYLNKLSSYIDVDRLFANLIDVVFNSSYRGIENGNRLALLQANPWFWISPIGMLIFFNSKNKKELKVFMVICLFIFVFYLAGENMSLQKLKFHCLRYVSSIWILFSYMVVVFLEYFVCISEKIINKYLRGIFL